MNDPTTEIIHCHGCSNTKMRIVQDPITGKRPVFTNDLRKWRWIILQQHCYCKECAPQALADALDDLLATVNSLSSSRDL